MTSEALRAQAIAEVTAQRWTHLFHSLRPPKDTRPLGSDEALSLLFHDARVLSISQVPYKRTSLIARLEHCRVEATIEPGIVHLCVSAHCADVARKVARAFGDPGSWTTATGLGPGGTVKPRRVVYEPSAATVSVSTCVDDSMSIN